MVPLTIAIKRQFLDINGKKWCLDSEKTNKQKLSLCTGWTINWIQKFPIQKYLYPLFWTFTDTSLHPTWHYLFCNQTVPVDKSPIKYISLESCTTNNIKLKSGTLEKCSWKDKLPCSSAWMLMPHLTSQSNKGRLDPAAGYS